MSQSHTVSTPVRYDCGNGGAQHCYGCYSMEEHESGDYVRYEDYRLLQSQLALVCKLARIYYDDRHPQEHAVLSRAEALADDEQLCACGAFEMDGQVLHSANCPKAPK